MKNYLSLFMFICLIKITRADDFKLDIATELIQVVSLENVESENPFVPALEKSAAEIEANNPRLSDAQSSDSGSTQQDKPETNPNKPKPFSTSQAASRIEQGQQLLMTGADHSVRGMVAELGFYSKQPSVQTPYANDLFDQLHDEVRLMVGENVYAEMASTYFDLKQLDNWIYATMSQYDVFGDRAMAGTQNLSDLNQPSTADSIFLGLLGDKAVLGSAQAAGSHANLTSRESMGLTTSYAMHLSDSDFEDQSKFFLILKYLTIVNFLYLMLSIMGVMCLVKSFKFFDVFKQQARQERQER